MTAKKRVIIMGGGGGGQVAASVIEDINRVEPVWEVAGFLNDGQEIGSKMGPYDVIGRTEEAADYVQKGYFLHYALHNAKFSRQRIRHFKEMNLPEEAFPTFVHPTAHTSTNLGIGPGAMLAAYAILSFGVKLGSYTHLYANAFIGHDTTVGDFVSISNNSAVGSMITIGDGSHLGTNCSIRERVQIGASAIVGIGAVVLKDVGEGEIAVGNPAKIIGNVNQYEE